MDETKLTAALPNLDIQILHRDYPEERAEEISVTFRATPDFDSVARAYLPLLGAALSGVAGGANPMLTPWMAPLRMWAEVTRLAWAPWLTAMGMAPRIGRAPGPR